MSTIKVKAVDQNIVFTDLPRIYSGDVNTDIMVFDFDEVWDGFLKTAVFYRDIEKPYFQVMEDTECVVPHEVMTEAGKFYVGVVGVKGDKVITSEVIGYDIGQGIMTPVETPPSADVWQQILAELLAIRTLAAQLRQDQSDFIDAQNQDREEYQAQWRNEVESSITEAQQATVQCHDAISSLQLEIFDMNGGDPFTQPSEDDIDANGGYPA